MHQDILHHVTNSESGNTQYSADDLTKDNQLALELLENLEEVTSSHTGYAESKKC
jgi:hypothetical protein